MSRTQQPLLPALQRIAKSLGGRLQMARCRRNLSATLFAERMGISRNTLQRVEAGDPSVSLGTYLRALRVLGLENDIATLAQDDELGRKLQDIQSLKRQGARAPFESRLSDRKLAQGLSQTKRMKGS